MNRLASSSIIEGYSGIRKLATHHDFALYSAHDDFYDRNVVLCVFNKDVSEDRELRIACAHELHAQTRLIHPNIVTITSYGLWRSNPYVVTAAKTGKTLKQLTHQNRLSAMDKYHVAVDMLRAVQHAHRNGVIHGNIAPINVIIDETGHSYLTNFALRAIHTSPNNSSDFAPNYDGAFVAPERKIDARTITRATDIYGLGVLCFYLLTRKVPESKTQSEVLQAAGVDLTLRKMIMSMMSHDAHQRPLDLEAPIQLFLRLAASFNAKEQLIDPILTDKVLPSDTYVFLDTLHELVDKTVYLYHRRTDQKLFIAKSRPTDAPGYDEAEKLMGLRHPHILPVQGVARNRSAQVIVTEYRLGGDLLGQMAWPWRIEKCLDFLENMLSALELAHKNGVIHKNLRPWHILLDEAGVPAIADFGLAQESLEPEINHGYAVPGEVPSEQGDLFSLGVITYELLVGSRPYFVGEQLDPAPRFSELPQAIRSVLESLLVVAPEARHVCAEEALYELQVARGKIAPRPRVEVPEPPSDPEAVPQKSANNMAVKAMMFAAVGCFVGALLWGGATFWRTGQFWPLIGLQPPHTIHTPEAGDATGLSDTAQVSTVVTEVLTGAKPSHQTR